MRRIAELISNTTARYSVSGHGRFYAGDIIEFISNDPDEGIVGEYMLMRAPSNNTNSICQRCSLYKSGVNCPRYNGRVVKRICDKIPSGYLVKVGDVLEEL
jgi:hypothetical protein